MPEKWTGEVIGKMHVNQVRAIKLAEALGWHPKYLSSVLNGHNKPDGAETKVKAALDRIIKEGTI